MKQTKKKKGAARPQKWLAVLLGLALGAGAGLALLPWIDRQFGSRSLLVLELALIGAALLLGGISWLLTILIHESGHLAAGLLSGYRFVSFRVLSLMLIRRGGRLALKRFKLAGTGGQCLMKPPAWTEKGIPVQLYNWGGVLANLLACALLLPGVLLTPRDTAGGAFLLLLLVVNAYTALSNGIPVMSNDGDNAIHLAGNLQPQYAFWQQMTANALLAEGVAQRDLPDELFALPEDADLSNPLVAAVAANAAEHELTMGRADRSEEMTEALLRDPAASLMPVHRFLLRNDLVYLRLLRTGRPDGQTEEILRDAAFVKYRKAMADYPAVIRTAYAEAVAAGNQAEAEALSARLDRVAAGFPYPQEISRERELMRLMRPEAAKGEA